MLFRSYIGLVSSIPNRMLSAVHGVQPVTLGRARKVKNNEISVNDINESFFQQHLVTQDEPPVDLLIRTSGEQRISNFLLWQIAYAELCFLDVLWPDFSEKDFNQAIACYQQRHRRFGATE